MTIWSSKVKSAKHRPKTCNVLVECYAISWGFFISHFATLRFINVLVLVNHSSISQSLFESRTSQARGGVDVGKPLITSCSDVWLARKGHAVKPPSGSFHSHDFQMVMGFILSGVLPRWVSLDVHPFPFNNATVTWFVFYPSCQTLRHRASIFFYQLWAFKAELIPLGWCSKDKPFHKLLWYLINLH